MKIRRLYPWELMDTFPVLQQFNAECGSPLELDQNEFAALCARLVTADNGAFWAAFDDAGKMAGIIGGHLHYAPASTVLRASELAWYVSGEHRGGTLGIRLIKAFGEWAKERGAKDMLMASFHTSPTPGVADMLGRLGFKPVETHHVLTL